MKNVTKQDLVQDASINSRHTHVETREVAEQFMRLIGEYLAAGRMIEIRGFGTFYEKTRKPRPARNPRTGEEVHLNKRRVALWRASPDLKSFVADLAEGAP